MSDATAPKPAPEEMQPIIEEALKEKLLSFGIAEGSPLYEHFFGNVRTALAIGYGRFFEESDLSVAAEEWNRIRKRRTASPQGQELAKLVAWHDKPTERTLPDLPQYLKVLEHDIRADVMKAGVEAMTKKLEGVNPFETTVRGRSGQSSIQR
jgi:hypothetical protein